MIELQNTELWLPVVDYEDLYEVSDQGRIKSLERIASGSDGKQRVIKERILKGCVNSSGYRIFTVSFNSLVDTKYVHAEVLKAFVGPCPNGMIASTLGSKTDARLANLIYRSLGEANPHGQRKQKRQKISDVQLLSLRFMHSRGTSIADLARMSGLGYRPAFSLIKGHTRPV